MRGDHDIARLPKWAQNEITRLARDLKSAQEKLAAGPYDSDTFADAYDETPRPLGKGTVIEFREPSERRRFTVRLKENGRLDVMGRETILISPRASNVVEIAIRERGS